MSNQVDNRVVSMQFDNKRFESNVATSLNTLDKLKKSLKLDGATKGLEEIDKTAKKLDMSSLGRAVETVNSRFSALGIMGVTALTNITNSAVNAGKRMVSALTIDPIKTGFSEYETQINSVQTILANTESKGSTLQDVNNALAELNTYADKTIYNFTEMTRNIGTFTAAGVDLKTSTAAIKGIANLAAVSGSTSQQASTAMYQLSQAMASGTVKLMDWNSVVNAGMGGQVFQDALKETARVHGVAIDSMIKSEGSFRETLQKGWLTTDILTETLSKFTGDLSEKQLKQMGYTDEQIAGIVKMGNTANEAAIKVKTFTQLFDTLKEAAQSGWTKTWEIIVGDFGEAKELLTEISDTFGGIIGDSADSRNELLSGALSTGWKQLLNEGITDAAGFEERVTEVAKKHGVDLSKMINDETTFQDTLKQGWMTNEILSESITAYGDKLKGMSEAQLEAAGYTMKDVKAFEELEKKLKEGKISVEEFTNLMTRKSGRELLIEALRNALNGIVSVITPVKTAFREIFGTLESSQLYSLIQSFTEFTSKLTLNEKQSKNLRRTFAGLFAVLDIGVQAVKAIGGGILDLVKHIAPAGEGLLGITASIGDFLVGVRNSIKTTDLFGKIIKGIGDFLKPVAEGIKEFGRIISETFGELMAKAEIRFEPLTTMGNALKSIFIAIGKVLAKAMPLIVSLAKGIGTIFTSLMEHIASAIQGTDYNKMFDLLNGGIFSAIGIFIAKFIKSGGDILDNAGGILENIKEVIGGVGDALGAFTEQLKAKTLKEIATAIAILAGSLLVLSLIDSSKLTESLSVVTLLFGELLGSMSLFTKMVDSKSVGKITLIGTTLKSLAAAMLILAIAMKIAGSMSWKEMGVGLISITVGLGALVAAVNLLPDKKVNAAAKSIKKLSTSMVIFAVALKIMGSMSWKEMGVGLISMASGLIMMVGAVNLLPKDTSKRAAGMMGLATAMVILGAALKIMGSMSWKEMGVGLITMASGLALMVAAVNLLPKDTALKTLGMIGLATALVIMASALKVMGSMSWKEMGVALITLAGSLTVITAAMIFMQNALSGAAALLIVAGALAILAPVLETFASMGIGEIVKSLGMLAGVFAVIGLAGYLLAPVVPAIAGLAGSIALLGVGVLAAGVGVLALAAGITALGAALGVAGAGIVAFVAGIIGLIPFLIEQVGIGIIKLCEVIAGSVDAICAAITTIIVAVVEALVTCIPTIAEGAFKLIIGLLEILIEYLPKIVPLLVTLFVKLIDLIVEHLPTIVEAVFRFLGALLDAIASNISQLIEPMVKLFGAIFQGIADVIGPIIESVIAPLLTILKDLVVGIVEAIAPYLPELTACFVQITQVVCDAIVKIVEALAPFMPEMQKMVESVTEAVQAIVDAIVRLAEQIAPIISEISDLVGEIGEIIQTCFDGISDVVTSVGDSIKNVLDGIAGVIESIGEAALNAGTGFENLANGVKIITKLNLVDMAASLGAVATGVKNIAKHSKGISDTGTGMKKIADSVKISESAFNNIAAGITTMIENLAKIGPAATTAMTEFISAIKQSVTELTAVSMSVSTATSSITTSVTAMGTACVTVIKSFSGRFADAGKYLIQGLANGIRTNKPIATRAAQNVANAVESIIRSAWKINSPSKVFYKIALGVGEGIQYAFSDSMFSVKRSANELADTATNGFDNTIQKIAEFLTSDIDAQPTIRPVLDLSDVRAGANSISGMLSGNRTLAVSAPGVGAISASMANRQNGNNNLASAINKLAKSNGKSGDTYNFNGFSYSEGSDVADALHILVRAAKMEGRT